MINTNKSLFEVRLTTPNWQLNKNTDNVPCNTVVPISASSLTLVTGETTTNSGGWSSTSWTLTKMAAVAVFIYKSIETKLSKRLKTWNKLELSTIVVKWI